MLTGDFFRYKLFLELRNNKKKDFFNTEGFFVLKLVILSFISLTLHFNRQGKCLKVLPEEDSSFPNCTKKCVNYVNFKMAAKQRNLIANTMFTSCLFNNYKNKYIRHNKSQRLASWSPGNLPCWPWKQSSTWERILNKDSTK